MKYNIYTMPGLKIVDRTTIGFSLSQDDLRILRAYQRKYGLKTLTDVIRVFVEDIRDEVEEYMEECEGKCDV